jgi:DNA modification methylase
MKLNDLLFSDFELMTSEPIIETVVEDVFAQDARYTTAKVGDVYLCGRHRLVIGDSGCEEILTKALNNRKADLLLTDPPYGVDIEAVDKCKGKVIGRSNARVRDGVRTTIANDNLKESEFTSFIEKTFSVLLKHIRPGGVYYIFYGDNGPSRLAIPEALKNNGGHISSTIIWIKDQLLLSFADYKWKHEPIIYGWKKGASHKWYGGFNKSTVIERETIKQLNLNELSRSKLIKIIVKLLELGEPPSSIIRCDKPYRSTLHPTQKPIPLFKQFIQNSSSEGELVLDPFGGSGTTLLACEELNRDCAIIEIMPRYAIDSVIRWEQLTGKKAIKL